MKSRGPFSFSFSPNFHWTYPGIIEIDLTYLSLRNTIYQKNLRCFMYCNNKLSHDFGYYDITELSAIKMSFKSLNSSYSQDYG